MRWLVLGATGSLGCAVMAELDRRCWSGVGAARSDAEERLDVTNLTSLEALLTRTAPDAVINCAAMVELAACETDPGGAYAVNARPVARLAEWAQATGRPLVQVSTDQFFMGRDEREDTR